MGEEQFEPRSCKLDLALLRYGGVKTSYDAKTGLRRSTVLSGRIHDRYDHYIGPLALGDSAFDGKPVHVDISSPPDLSWLEEIRDRHGVDGACGAAFVKAGVEAEQVEPEIGEPFEVEPVQVTVMVSTDAFEAICRQAAEAHDHRRIIGATVILAGNSLPSPRLKEVSIRPKELDVSADRGYAVSSFEIFDSRYTDHLRGRVLRVERGREEGYGARISIQLTEGRYEVDVERALVRAISCEGRVINASGKPYDGAEVTIEFSEHEPNSFDELPERAFFGEFGYYPKQPDKEYSSTRFMFDLRYVPGDARDLLIPLLSQEIGTRAVQIGHEMEGLSPLLSQEVGTRVVLAVNLANEDAELLAATDELRGNVRRYDFKVWRRLSEDSHSAGA